MAPTQKKITSTEGLNTLLEESTVNVGQMAVIPEDVVRIVNKSDLASVDMRAALIEIERKKKQRHREYSQEEKVPTMLAPSYAKHFGRVMMITINGISIALPVDGRMYDIPKTFAQEAHRRRMAIDAIERKQKIMANIKGNFDGNNPGALPLF